MHSNESQLCSKACSCSEEAFNPVCGSNGVEFRSPCHAGCKIVLSDSVKVLVSCFHFHYVWYFRNSTKMGADSRSSEKTVHGLNSI